MPARPSTFDYSVLLTDQADLARDAAAHCRDIESASLLATNAWLTLGQKLLRVSNALADGHYAGWLRAEIGISDKTAKRYIAAYEILLPYLDTDNLSELPKLSRSAAYLLCEERAAGIVATFAPRIVDGEPAVRKQILDALDALKPAISEKADEVDTADEDEPTRPRPRDARAETFIEGIDRADLSRISETLRLIRAGVPLDDIEAAIEWKTAPTATAAPIAAEVVAAEEAPSHAALVSPAEDDPAPAAEPHIELDPSYLPAPDFVGTRYKPERPLRSIVSSLRADIYEAVRAGSIPDLNYLIETGLRDLRITTRAYRELKMSHHDLRGVEKTAPMLHKNGDDAVTRKVVRMAYDYGSSRDGDLDFIVHADDDRIAPHGIVTGRA